jgi:hypothetical protein
MTIGVVIDSVDEALVHAARMKIAIKMKQMRITITPISKIFLLSLLIGFS